MSSFELQEPDRFTSDAVGPPGQRIFYLQGVQGTEVVTLRLEKQQVAVLVERLREVLSDLPMVGDDERPTDLTLVEPAIEEWIVGAIAYGYDQAGDRVVVEAQELVDPEAEIAEEDVDTARFHLTRAQVAAFCDHAETVIAGGRPLCPLCGRPMDAEGHVCPRSNGHLH